MWARYPCTGVLECGYPHLERSTMKVYLLAAYLEILDRGHPASRIRVQVNPCTGEPRS